MVHTLGVQVVLNRNGVVLLEAELLLRVGSGERIPVSGVLLLEILDLFLQGESLLFIYSVFVHRATKGQVQLN